MKKYLLAVLLLAPAVLALGQDQFRLRIKLRNLDEGKVMIAYMDGNRMVVDSNAVVRKNYREFKGAVSAPVICNVIVRKEGLAITSGKSFIPAPSLQLVLTNDKIAVDGDANEIYMARVKGGRPNDEWRSGREKEAQLTRESWLAQKAAHGSKDSVVLAKVKALRSASGDEMLRIRRSFIASNPDAFMSMYFLSGLASVFTTDELAKAYAGLGDTWKKSAQAQAIEQKLEAMKKSAIGSAAIPLNKKDMNGQPVNLATLQGKYVLLDFWGSWCVPCRNSHPHLKELYAQYREKGFEIVGIAHEQGRDLAASVQSWKEAVAQDGINWVQVLNNEGMDDFDAVRAYGVSAFPTKILLDREGRIIGRYVGDDKRFDEKLREIFAR